MNTSNIYWEKKVLDYFHIGIYFLFFFSDNPKQSSQIPVFIRILDINDHAPEFANYYETFVCENAKAGQVNQYLYYQRTCKETIHAIMKTSTYLSLNSSRLIQPLHFPSSTGHKKDIKRWRIISQYNNIGYNKKRYFKVVFHL